jgi:hypothetical protein
MVLELLTDTVTGILLILLAITELLDDDAIELPPQSAAKELDSPCHMLLPRSPEGVLSVVELGAPIEEAEEEELLLHPKRPGDALLLATGVLPCILLAVEDHTLVADVEEDGTPQPPSLSSDCMPHTLDEVDVVAPEDVATTAGDGAGLCCTEVACMFIPRSVITERLETSRIHGQASES